MTLSTLLVHLDDSPACATRVRLAARLAQAHDAHLVGLAATGSLEMPPQARAALGDALWFDFVRGQDDRVTGLAARFEQEARAAGATRVEPRTARGDVEAALMLHGRYADLLVMGKPDGRAGQGAVDHDAMVHLLREVGRPVLLVPQAGAPAEVGRRVLVAWGATRESMRAVTDAVPLLVAADRVDVLVFNARHGSGVSGSHGEQVGADLARWLARHGAQVEVHDEVTDIDVGSALLSRAADFGADLVVMGAYGHSALRERLFGGVTETVLRAMPVPVLMSH